MVGSSLALKAAALDALVAGSVACASARLARLPSCTPLALKLASAALVREPISLRSFLAQRRVQVQDKRGGIYPNLATTNGTVYHEPSGPK